MRASLSAAAAAGAEAATTRGGSAGRGKFGGGKGHAVVAAPPMQLSSRAPSSPYPSSASPTRRGGRPESSFASADRRRGGGGGGGGDRAPLPRVDGGISSGNGGGLRFSTSTSSALPPPLSSASEAAAARAGLGQFEPAWTKEDEEAVRAASAASVAVPEPSSSSTSSSSKAAAAAVAAPAPPLPLLLSMSADELKALAVSDGESAYRGQQVFDSITKGAATVDEIRGIPAGWKAKLSEKGFQVGRASVHSSALSADGTQKLLLRLSDGHVVEAVGIPSRDGARLTVCVSSQVGCPMRCSFCATGKGGYARNLTQAEIVGQVIAVRAAFEARAKEQGKNGSSSPVPNSRVIPTRVSNVVFMGMGEPALNLKAVLPALREINSRLGVGARRLTLSTVGVPNTIATRLAAENLQFTLAVSLHAPTQELREKLVPSAKAYPLDALLSDCQAYFEASGGRRVTFEYALLSGVNDSQAHAAQLARLLKRYDLRSHVNLIPFNPIGDLSPFAAPPRASAAAFEAALTAAGVPASVRGARGSDASAACGQLRNEHQRRGAALGPMPVPPQEVGLGGGGAEGAAAVALV